ncbi:MAG: hypothetical protein QOJ43_663 [Gaiellaceae bacterium]|jgi:hypothetical protein|nr:hypothetical protein [Gaiellaceae bacterium]
MGGRVGAATLALLAALALASTWNALHYPPGLGYDAIDHIAYAEGIRAGDGLPDGIGEYYTPPGFYALAAGAMEVGDRAGLGDPRRLVQLLNAALALATALLLLALARELWPGRSILHLAALGFFVGSALVLKAAAMFHPETLDLFLSTLALVLAARMIVRDDWRTPQAVLLGVVLGAGQLVRAFSLWTFAVVLVALAAALADQGRRRRILLAGAATLAATAAVAGPWYVHQARDYANPIFDRPQVAKPLWERRPVEFYVDPGLPELITRPYRPSFENRFWPQLYAEWWGDWFGAFAWQSAKGDPGPATRRELQAQSLAGLLPTALSVAGWVWLLALSLRRLRSRPELLLVSLLPLAGMAGMLYFTVSYPTPDGDVIKATYMLTTLPAWALAFGIATERAARSRLRLVVGALLVAAAIVSLRFGVYGSPLGGLL